MMRQEAIYKQLNTQSNTNNATTLILFTLFLCLYVMSDLFFFLSQIMHYYYRLLVQRAATVQLYINYFRAVRLSSNE